MPHLLNSRRPRSLTKDSKIPTLNSQPLVQTALYLLWMMSALNVSFISGNAVKLWQCYKTRGMDLSFIDGAPNMQKCEEYSSPRGDALPSKLAFRKNTTLSLYLGDCQTNRWIDTYKQTPHTSHSRTCLVLPPLLLVSPSHIHYLVTITANSISTAKQGEESYHALRHMQMNANTYRNKCTQLLMARLAVCCFYT